MRDYGNDITPNYTTLPATGVAGQRACMAGQHYYWNTVYGAWLQIDDWYETSLTAAYTNATTTLSTVFSFPVVANATYAFEWKYIWSASALVGLKQAIVIPSGTFNALGEVSAVTNGTTTPTFHELATSGTAQTGPTAGVVSTGYFGHGRGIVSVGTTAGVVALQMAASGTGTLTIAKGSLIKARRNA